MRSKFIRGLFFCLLVAFFTIFGQRRSESWSYVTTDAQGLEYLVEERSIHWLSHDRVRFQLAAVDPEGRRQEATAQLDLADRVYQNEGGPEQEVRPGTAAHQLMIWFGHRQRAGPGL